MNLCGFSSGLPPKNGAHPRARPGGNGRKKSRSFQRWKGIVRTRAAASPEAKKGNVRKLKNELFCNAQCIQSNLMCIETRRMFFGGNTNKSLTVELLTQFRPGRRLPRTKNNKKPAVPVLGGRVFISGADPFTGARLYGAGITSTPM